MPSDNPPRQRVVQEENASREAEGGGPVVPSEVGREPPGISGGRWRRRVVTIPGVAVAWVLLSTLLPVALILLAIADSASVPRRWARCRAVVAMWWLLTCELVGLIAAFALWVRHVWRRDDADFRVKNVALQRAWTEALFRGAARIFRLRLNVAGVDAASRGPYLLFVRHASVLDTLLAATLIANPHRITFRYVLKRELLWDPCLDVVGGRLHNAFVARGRALGQGDVAAVRALAQGLEASEGVLLYPEGTRYTRGKLERALARLSGRALPGVYERAARLRHVLPPRPGGPLALIDAAPELDVVFLTHTGLESAATLFEFWRGGLVGATIHAQLRRVPAADIPRGSAERLEWLFEQWLEVDRWIENVRASQ